MDGPVLLKAAIKCRYSPLLWALRQTGRLLEFLFKSSSFARMDLAQQLPLLPLKNKDRQASKDAPLTDICNACCFFSYHERKVYKALNFPVYIYSFALSIAIILFFFFFFVSIAIHIQHLISRTTSNKSLVSHNDILIAVGAVGSVVGIAAAIVGVMHC